MKFKSLTTLEFVETMFFQAHIIVVVRVVNSDDIVPSIKQELCDAIGDKACSARYEISYEKTSGSVRID